MRATKGSSHLEATAHMDDDAYGSKADKPNWVANGIDDLVSDLIAEGIVAATQQSLHQILNTLQCIGSIQAEYAARQYDANCASRSDCEHHECMQLYLADSCRDSPSECHPHIAVQDESCRSRIMRRRQCRWLLYKA